MVRDQEATDDSLMTSGVSIDSALKRARTHSSHLQGSCVSSDRSVSRPISGRVKEPVLRIGRLTARVRVQPVGKPSPHTSPKHRALYGISNQCWRVFSHSLTLSQRLPPAPSCFEATSNWCSLHLMGESPRLGSSRGPGQRTGGSGGVGFALAGDPQLPLMKASHRHSLNQEDETRSPVDRSTQLST